MATETRHPFTYSNADIIFRSSDNVVYRLHKLILSLASDFFNDMFELPQPTQSSDSKTPTHPTDSQSTDSQEADGLPVISVSEPSTVLTPLFMLCYPIDSDLSIGSTIAQVRAVLEAAIKYDLRKAVRIARGRLRQFIRFAPLRVYAIACKLGFEDDARDAAKEVHKQQVQHIYVEELEEIPFGTYHRLLYFCAQSGGSSAPGPHFFFSHASTTIRTSTGATETRPIKKIPQRGAGVAPSPSSTGAPSNPTEPPFAAAPPLNGSSDPQTCSDKHPPETTDIDDRGVVFVTSDGVELRSAGDAILRASPDLRAKRSSSTESIHVSVSSATMKILIRIYDPFEHVELASLLDVHHALAAAVEYKLQKAIAFLQASLKSRQATAPAAATYGDPLLLFAIACRFGMRDLALQAARATLRTNITNQLMPAIDDVDISAGYLHRLLDYQRRCRAAITPIFQTRTWIQGFWLPRVQLQNAPCAPKTTPPAPLPFAFAVPAKWVCWYEPYMKAAAASALWPSSASVTREDVLYAGLCVNPAASVAGASALPMPGHCSHCMQGKGAVELFQFSQYVASTITTLESQVSLTWPTVRQTAPVPTGSS